MQSQKRPVSVQHKLVLEHVPWQTDEFDGTEDRTVTDDDKINVKAESANKFLVRIVMMKRLN